MLVKNYKMTIDNSEIRTLSCTIVTSLILVTLTPEERKIKEIHKYRDFHNIRFSDFKRHVSVCNMDNVKNCISSAALCC
jgi:hypothetical protein